MTATISPRANREIHAPQGADAHSACRVIFSTPRASTMAVLGSLLSRITHLTRFPDQDPLLPLVFAVCRCSVVGATRNSDVVAVCGAVVVPALQVQLATRGADVPVVELSGW